MFGATQPEVQAVGVPGPTQRDTNNWGPRVGFAYSPNASSGIGKKLFGEGKSSIRGGFGIVYDVLFENILINTAGNYPRSITQNDSGLIDVFPALRPKTATVPALDPTAQFANTPVNAQNPTTNFWTLSVQRQLGMNTIVEVGYTGNRSYHMVRQFQTNPAILTQDQAAAVLAAGNGNVIPNTAARRLNPAWGSRVLVDTTGKGEYHAGYVKVDKRFAHGWMLGANYTWSANFSDSDEALALADIGNSSPQVPQDFRNLSNEWSRSVFDRPHRFAVYYTYQIPWFVNSPEVLTHIFGGWQAAGFTEFQSGQPFTIRVGVDTLGNAASSSFPPGRPNYNPGGILIKDPDTGNLRTFTIPLNGTGIVTAPCATPGGVCPQNGPFTFLTNSMPTGGNLGRNTFRGPGFENWDVSLMKKIAVREGWQVQLRGDFINALNHDNFQNPVANMNSPVFGANTATPLADAREVLMTVKIAF